MNEPELIKIFVDLPNHWAVGGESLWARPLGDDLYEIRNSPFFAYNLNFLDVVEAKAASPDSEPEIQQLVKRSGHQTIRVIFSRNVPLEERHELLQSLNAMEAAYEAAGEFYYALDLRPQASCDAIRDRLEDWVERGLVDYETCEERVPGGFDDTPDE